MMDGGEGTAADPTSEPGASMKCAADPTPESGASKKCVTRMDSVQSSGSAGAYSLVPALALHCSSIDDGTMRTICVKHIQRVLL